MARWNTAKMVAVFRTIKIMVRNTATFIWQYSGQSKYWSGILPVLHGSVGHRSIPDHFNGSEYSQSRIEQLILLYLGPSNCKTAQNLGKKRNTARNFEENRRSENSKLLPLAVNSSSPPPFRDNPRYKWPRGSTLPKLRTKFAKFGGFLGDFCGILGF